ncbi:MAG: histidine phosphatase family protein [Polyangiaceae bacterium]
MTTRVLLVRHGATTLSVEDRFAGSTDVDLSEEGRAQVSALAARLTGEKVDAVFASPLRRTVETATILAAPHGLGIVTHDGLREIDHGRWEGMTRREVESKYEGEYSAWEEDPFTFAPEGGESGLSVMARALPVIREIVTTHTGKTVVVASHKATIRLVLCSFLGIDARGYRDRLDQSPACLNVLEFKDPVRARLIAYNDVAHYGPKIARAGSGQLSKWWDPKSP